VKRATVKKAMDDRPHPFGDDRAARIERWRAMSILGDAASPLTAIAKLAVEAAEAPTGAKRNAAALFALGLHGPEKTDNNRQALREALAEVGYIVDAVYPPLDDVDYTTTQLPPPAPTPATYDADIAARELEEAGGAARKRYDELVKGVPTWLYGRVNGNVHGDEETHTQFLHRQAKRGTELRQVLDWALSLAPSTRPPTRPVARNSRGRVR
jgi:hypothetical protein